MIGFEKSAELMINSFEKFAAKEAAWSRSDSHGRWVVLERGPGHLLRDSPRWMRDYVDAITPRRGRRFASLSRARAFAREVHGIVRRWRDPMPHRGPWRNVGPWERALSRTFRLRYRAEACDRSLDVSSTEALAPQ